MGYGSVNFLGNFLNIKNSSFVSNFNRVGGAIFIGGSKNFFVTNIFIIDVILMLNSAFTFGGAIAFGSDTIQVQGEINNITCIANSALCKFYIYVLKKKLKKTKH